MGVTLIHRELIQLEIENLPMKESQQYLKESIEKVSFYYNVLPSSPLPKDNVDFLQQYWKLKLNLLLEMYKEKHGTNLFFLTSREEKIVRKYRDKK
jgi:hypothetical protein